jgi:hypothetical protein
MELRSELTAVEPFYSFALPPSMVPLCSRILLLLFLQVLYTKSNKVSISFYLSQQLSSSPSASFATQLPAI